MSREVLAELAALSERLRWKVLDNHPRASHWFYVYIKFELCGRSLIFDFLLELRVAAFRDYTAAQKRAVSNRNRAGDRRNRLIRQHPLAGSIALQLDRRFT